MTTKSSSWPGFEKRGAKEIDQCSAPTSYPHKSSGGGNAVEAGPKHTAPRSFPKGAGGGGDAVVASDKGEYPRSFPKSGYDGSQPCDNQLNKRAAKGTP